VSSVPAVPAGPGGKDALIGRRIFGSPLSRRMTYAVIFEILAVGFATGIFALMGNEGGSSFVAGLVSSIAALIWNLVFNWIFEILERRIKITHRPWYMRVAHAAGYEGGLLIILVPLIALILGVSLLQALVMQSGLLVFFLIYAASYAWVFDRVFGLPEPPENYR